MKEAIAEKTKTKVPEVPDPDGVKRSFAKRNIKVPSVEEVKEEGSNTGSARRRRNIKRW